MVSYLARSPSCSSRRSGTSIPSPPKSSTSRRSTTSGRSLGARLPRRHHSDGHDGRCRHGRLRRARVSDRLLHGAHRVATDASHPRGRRTRPAVGELPRQGLHLANHPGRERRAQLDARAVRPPWSRLLARGHLDRLHVPLAALHDPPRLRRARAHPALAARGIRRSRRSIGSRRSSGSSCHWPSRRSSPARSSPSRSRSATTSRPRSSRASSSSATSSTTTSASRTTCRSPPRTRWCRSPSWSATSTSPSAWGRSRISDGRRARNTLAPADRDGAGRSDSSTSRSSSSRSTRSTRTSRSRGRSRTGRPSGSPSLSTTKTYELRSCSR